MSRSSWASFTLLGCLGSAAALALDQFSLIAPIAATAGYFVSVAISALDRKPQGPWITAGLSVIFLLFGAGSSALAQSSKQITPDHIIVGVALLVMAWLIAKSIAPAKKDSHPDATTDGWEQVEEGEVLLREIIENVPVGLLIKDADHIVEKANSTYMNWYGHDPETLGGRKSHELEGFQTPEDAETMYAQERDVLKNGVTLERTIERAFADGTTHTLNIKKFPVRNSAGEIVRVGSVTLDMTDQVLAQKALREQERLLNSIVDNLPEALVVKDTQGRRSLINATYGKWYGVKPEEVLNRTHLETRGNDDGEAIRSYEQEQKAMDTGQPISRELIRTFADGSPHYLRLTKYPIYDEAEDVAGVATVSVDLTEQVEARRAQEDSEAKFRDFAEVSADWFWEMDADLRFTYFSERSREITGFDPSVFLGKSRQEIAADQGELTKWKDHNDDLDSKRPFRNFVYDIETKSGDVLSIRISGKPVFDEDGRFAGYRGTGTDVSDQLRIQRARDNALVVAEQANRAKSQFLATMSHEFRTPLNAILGFSDMIANRYLGSDDFDRYSEYASDIHESAAHLLELVNDLLDISAIEAGKTHLQKENLPLEGLLEDCLHTVSDQAVAKGVSLHLESGSTSAMIYADQRAAKQVILNLLTNAVKFTPPNGIVTLQPRVSAKGCELSVIDTGPGIPAERLSDITNPFKRGPEATYTADKGWGLGLAICQALMDLHGGHLKIESIVGQGTTVEVFFPATDTQFSA